MEGNAPKALSYWFILHFIIDLGVAIPLFFFPAGTLEFLGWTTVDTLLTRVVAAAFFGIGIESLLGRNSTPEGFKGMLNLKIIWSLAAAAGIAWSMISGSQGRPIMGWGALAVFAAFHFLWIYWRVRIGRMLQKTGQN